MHRTVVEEHRWIGEAPFPHALGYCTLLPGPEAQQHAACIGWLTHRAPGGAAAGTQFVLLAFMALFLLLGYGKQCLPIRIGPASAARYADRAAMSASAGKPRGARHAARTRAIAASSWPSRTWRSMAAERR